MDDVLERARGAEPQILDEGSALLAELIERDDWLPVEFLATRADAVAQYLLHCDRRDRFCVISLVWDAGQGTPIHDHGVWGLIGVLRGSEEVTPYRLASDGRPIAGVPIQQRRGEVSTVSPAFGDVHRVSNSFPGTTVSIHVYGGNVARLRRNLYDPASGAIAPYVTQFANRVSLSAL